ncbi:polymorphic toxin-type HINT domain-containing protein, partial [Clostridium paraputrificum]
MSDFCIEEESTQAKAKIATDAIENIIETMMRAENYINYAISLINEDEELSNLNFPSQRAFYDKLREDKDKLSRFGKICSQYDDEVDKPFTKDYEKLVAQISDIKSEEIIVPNNIGATEVEYYKDERNGGRDWKSRVKLKDTISFEDVLSYGDIGELMKKNYEQYCISLEGKEGNEKGEYVPPKFEEYLNELIHQGEFDYKIVEPWQEYVSLAIDCIPVIGDGKAIIEAALGQEFFTGRELSSLERGLCLISIIPFFGDGAKIFGKGAKELTEVGLKRGIRFNSKVFGTELLKNVAIISGTTTLSSIGINPLVCMVLYSGGKGAKGAINLIQSTDLFKNFELPKRNFLNTIKFKSNKVMEYLQDSKLINGEYHITLKEKINGVVGIILKESDLTPLERFGCSIGCFTEETLVLTEKGFKRIKEISESDRVLSQNEATGEQSYQVAKLIRKKSKEIVSVKIKGQIINATIEHPFMTDQGWVKAGELHEGSKVLNSRKEYEVVESIEYKGYNEIEVYNLI